MSRFVVYRMYDADENLLYVGRSTRGPVRCGEHGAKSWWDDVDTITVEHWGSERQARSAEAWAIEEEKPLHNRQRPAPVPSWAASLARRPEEIAREEVAS